MTQNEYLRYLGVLGLLGECSVFVDEETRECIERAFAGACAAHPTLAWRRILDRIEIYSKALDQARSAGAVDPRATDPGKPSTRETTS